MKLERANQRRQQQSPLGSRLRHSALSPPSRLPPPASVDVAVSEEPSYGSSSSLLDSVFINLNSCGLVVVVQKKKLSFASVNLAMEHINIPVDCVVDQVTTTSSSPSGYRLVPWLNWEEWECIRDSLFSDSPHKVSFALRRISTWRSRGCLPVVIDVTAAIIEIQLKDPLYRKDLPHDAIHSEQMLAMLYCMAILRLVNCVIEKTRKKNESSIAEAAGAIGIPRSLIDIRHEGSHRDLPALPLVRDSAAKAIDWLKWYYWEPQTVQIPSQRDGATLRKEIKLKFRELAACLKVKQSPQTRSSVSKGKSSKKSVHRILKYLINLYSSFSSEVLSVLLDFLLKALDSSNLVCHPKEYEVDEKTMLDVWKLMITKFSKKEPELLLTLIKAVLNVIASQDFAGHMIGMRPASTEYNLLPSQTEGLCSVFLWLVGQLNELKLLFSKDAKAETRISSTGMSMSNAMLIEILRKCLLTSSCGNKQLMDGAKLLSQIIGNRSLTEKLNKLSSHYMSESDVPEDAKCNQSPYQVLIQHEKTLCQATDKLEKLQRQRGIQGRALTPTDGHAASSGRWVVAKSWNPCAIGMLPSDLGSSGRLPVLDQEDAGEKRMMPDSLLFPEEDETRELEKSNNIKQCSNCLQSLEDDVSLKKSGSKREATSSDLDPEGGSDVKRMRETSTSGKCSWELGYDGMSSAGSLDGCLMMDGVWKKVGEEEVHGMKSGARILI
ncbi:Ribosomal biogenesis protein LAS1L [Linum perenne]